MKRTALLWGAVVLLAVSAGADDDERGKGHGREDRRVHELMERTHEGRRSPYGRLRRAVEGEAIPWPAVEQAVKELERMCRALLESQDDEIEGSADGYVDAVKALAAGVRKHDADAVRAGFRSLAQSCGDCHFDGGVGGRLEHGFGAARDPGRDRGRRERDD